ncbi:hypothetical protein ABL78_3340 [Leptomonas seymouri]|uniref:Uncharacterized protein n=1 Tax=Leptomonas seymouri TaxID=5684 RepID=A0A0N0P6G4_LEPSE|nr:hypothetical protein ABL78_3340 [Leptomonas seymouri]|eukprot:KPI87589.1 hypothetical protein ABL78_3340 [Leptomonas seymouri]
MSTINVDGGTSDVPDGAAASRAPAAHRAASSASERAADYSSEAVMPDAASIVAAATIELEAGLAKMDVPLAESHSQASRPADKCCMTHPYVSWSPSQPVVNGQQQDYPAPEIVRDGKEERLEEARAAGGCSAFRSPALEEGQTPTCFEAGEAVVGAGRAIDEDAAAPTSKSETTIGARVDAVWLHMKPVSSLASIPANGEAAAQGRGNETRVPAPLSASEENGASAAAAAAAASASAVAAPLPSEPISLGSDATFAAASPGEGFSPSTRTATPATADPQAWVVDFGTGRQKTKRKMTKKEQDAIKESRLRSQGSPTPVARTTERGSTAGDGLGADSEGNAVMVAHDAAAALQVVHLDGLADRAAQIPRDLTTTRADLEKRLVLRLPRLLCVTKQYPRGCGIASLTSVYNYLYSWLGESEAGAWRAPISQEEIMSILGFEPPFGEIAWGPFTGNATLIRWFHALNRHFGHQGKAYILYKVHGHGKTTHIYPDNAAALVAVKAALRDPHCALIYHCHNHYMVPVGYQEIPHAQTDFFKPDVLESNCDTTIFIGEVSRGRHEAVYARKWEHIVRDIECRSPFYFNIRHPEQGVQKREPPRKKAAAGVDAVAESPRPPPQDGVGAEVLLAGPAAQVPVPPTLFIPMPPSLRDAKASASAQQQRVGMEGAIGDAVPAAVFKEGEEARGYAQGAAAHAEEEGVGAALRTEETAAQGVVPSSFTPGVHVVVESLPSSPLESDYIGVDDVAGAASEDTRVEEVPAAAAVAHPQSSKISETQKPAAADGLPLSARADIKAEGIDDADPAEPSASLDTHAAAFDAAIAAPPSSDTAGAGPCTYTAPVPLDNCAAPPQPAALSAAPSANMKPKKERGNLHCLIIFRTDQVEEQLERYEEATAKEGEQRAAKTAVSSSAPSSDDSSSSDEDEG